MDEKKKKYLMFYDVNDVQGNSVVGTHPMELSYSDNPIKTLLDKNVPIHKVYCLDNDSHLPDMDMLADDFNHEELFVADWWCYTFESTDDEVMKWLDGCEDEEDEEYLSAEDEALWDERLSKLSKCQVIGQDHDLYDWLNGLEDIDFITINDTLAERHYHLSYNNIDECYVVS